MARRTKAKVGSGRRRPLRTVRGKRARAGKAVASGLKPVGGSDRPKKKGARRLRKADQTQTIEVTLMLRGPPLPEIGAGRALSPAAFKVKYGASKRDADKVSRVLRRHGLTIVEVSRHTRSMKVSGTIARMEAVFDPRMGEYESKDQGRFRDRAQNYKVPASLQGIVKAVLGFGERRVARRRPSKTKVGTARGFKPFTPEDIERHYRFPPGDASGQKIAIAEFGGGYFAGDLADYCAAFKREVPRVMPIGLGDTSVRSFVQMKQQLNRTRRRDAIGSTGEVMMDVQIIAGLCPAAELLVYFARDTQKGWVDVINRAIDDGPVVLSISWGDAEDSTDWAKNAVEVINEQLRLAAAHGITVCCAAGDDGSGDIQTNRRAHVDFPASSPYTLAVGGTMLRHKAGKPVEQAWRVGKGRRVRERGGATGGGVSVRFARETWQDVRIAPVDKIQGKGRQHKRGGRIVPDIAALAGPPMYDLIFQADRSIGGGTSASAPVLAALIARINALLPKHRRQRFLTRLLYQKSSRGVALGSLVCRDVTIGNNVSRPKPANGFKATKGFDAVSGWGTPIGTALLRALSRAR